MVSDYTVRWLQKALKDITVIENELAVEEKKLVTEAVCFHAQQAAEKFLKAWLAEKNIEFGRTHNLQILINLCAKEDKDFASLDAGDLTDYAVEIRYPDDFFVPSREEAEKSMYIAKSFGQFVLKKLDITEKAVREYPSSF